MNYQSLLKFFIVLAPCVNALESTAEGIQTEFSGFARAVAGQLSDSGVVYSGYDDNIAFDQNSLLGLQGKIKFNDQFSATALGLLHSNDKETGLEWLYLSYKPTNALKIKLGKMQTPFFSISDSLDVGYSYPWAIAPIEVYDNVLFKTFNGIDARYSLLFGDVTAHFEAYFGNFDGFIKEDDVRVRTKVDDLHGFISDLRYSNFSFRASYHSGSVDIDFPEFEQFINILSQSGFQQSADSLDPDGSTQFYQASAEYDSLKYFLKTEWININLASEFLADIKSYYLTYGYYFDKWTAHITYGNRNDDSVTPINEIPTGISPDLDFLALNYQFLFDSFPSDDIESWSLGLRWDVISNVALKTEYKIIKANNARSTSFLIEEGVNFDQKSNLFLIGIEWVF